MPKLIMDMVCAQINVEREFITLLCMHVHFVPGSDLSVYMAGTQRSSTASRLTFKHGSTLLHVCLFLTSVERELSLAAKSIAIQVLFETSKHGYCHIQTNMTLYTTNIAKFDIRQEFDTSRLEKEANDISLDTYVEIEFRTNGFIDRFLTFVGQDCTTFRPRFIHGKVRADTAVQRRAADLKYGSSSPRPVPMIGFNLSSCINLGRDGHCHSPHGQVHTVACVLPSCVLFLST